MDLEDQRGAALGEALDDGELPQRAVRRELGRHDAPDERIELRLAARRRARAPQHVLVDVELRVVDPERPREVEGDAQDALGELGDLVEARRDERLDLLERRDRVDGPARGMVELEDRGDVQRRAAATRA